MNKFIIEQWHYNRSAPFPKNGKYDTKSMQANSRQKWVGERDESERGC